MSFDPTVEQERDPDEGSGRVTVDLGALVPPVPARPGLFEQVAAKARARRRRRAGLSAAAAALALVAVVGVVARSGSGPADLAAPRLHDGQAGQGQGQGRVVGPSTAAGNRRLAEAEADRLLGLAPLPPGAVELGAPPAALAQAPETPAVDSLVGRARFWRVSLGAEETLAWLRAHPPAGLISSGSGGSTGSVTDPAGRVGFLVFDAPAADAWSQAELLVSVATDGGGDGGGSVLRVDAQVTWLDPTPLRDTLPGKRLSVAVSSGCPATLGGAVGVRSDGDDLDQALLPAAPPREGLACHYEDGPSLSGSIPLSAAQVAPLAAAARALPLAHDKGGIRNCPEMHLATTLLVLAYPGRPDVALWVQPTGCPSVSNGHIVAGGTIAGLP